MSARLITIGFSHFCEKARWALDLAGEDFREEQHLPIIHIRHAKKNGGKRTVPVLITEDGQVYDDSTTILGYVHGRHPELGLYPEDDGGKTREWEELFDETLGPHVRRFVYCHILDHKSFLRLLKEQRAGGEYVFWRSTSLLLRRLMRYALRISPAGGERSLAKLRGVFDQVEAGLEGGKRYLVGDAFSAADLTFAALAVPLLLPEEVPITMPAMSDLPAGLGELVEEFRSRPAGQYGLRLYREHRSLATSSQP